jgi:hypothetical protein
MSRALLVNAAVLLSALLCHTPASAQQPSESWLRGYAPGDPPLSPPAARVNEWSGRSEGLRTVRTGAFFSQPARGALSGKTIYLSPGHGWTYKASASWYSQRGKTHGVVEDMSNADGIRQFLLPYLWAAGAQVMPVRELDQQTEMQILDNADGTTSPSRGSYSESGDAALFTTSSQGGWGHPTLPLTSTENPFALGKNRLIKTSSRTRRRARRSCAECAASPGYYNWSTWPTRCISSAPLRRAHTWWSIRAAQTTYLVDQRRHGAYLGAAGAPLWFERGQRQRKKVRSRSSAISRARPAARSPSTPCASAAAWAFSIVAAGSPSKPARTSARGTTLSSAARLPASTTPHRATTAPTTFRRDRALRRGCTSREKSPSLFRTTPTPLAPTPAARLPTSTAEILWTAATNRRPKRLPSAPTSSRAPFTMRWSPTFEPPSIPHGKTAGSSRPTFGELNTSNQNEMPAALLEAGLSRPTPRTRRC